MEPYPNLGLCVPAFLAIRAFGFQAKAVEIEPITLANWRSLTPTQSNRSNPQRSQSITV